MKRLSASLRKMVTLHWGQRIHSPSGTPRLGRLIIAMAEFTSSYPGGGPGEEGTRAGKDKAECRMPNKEQRKQKEKARRLVLHHSEFLVRYSKFCFVFFNPNPSSLVADGQWP
jgi:hypothetical protein